MTVVFNIIVMIMVTLKGANQDFFTISSLRHELSPTCLLKWPGRNHDQITRNTSCAYHVLCVVCHVVQRDISDVKFDRV